MELRIDSQKFSLTNLLVRVYPLVKDKFNSIIQLSY
jgi:hypothetical protein